MNALAAETADDLLDQLLDLQDAVAGKPYLAPSSDRSDITLAEMVPCADPETDPAIDLERLVFLTDDFPLIDRRIESHDIIYATWLHNGLVRHRQLAGKPGQDADKALEALHRGVAGHGLYWPPRKPKAAPKASNDNAKPRDRFNVTWFNDIAEGEPKLWTIKGVIGQGEMTTISGLPGSGKSVITGDAGFHVAAGLEWFGRKVSPGMVAYVAAERRMLTERRMIALRKHYGVHDIPLVIISGRLDMTSSLTDARALADVVKEASEHCGKPCAWIILDTLTRVFGPGDQNTSKDMTKFVHACDELIRQTGAHLSVIHHTAWSGERGKGAIDLDGAVDASFLVSKNAGTYTLKCDGANDGEEGTVATFTLQSVEIAKDEDGEPTSAPIVVPGESVATKLAKGHEAQNVLAALRQAIAEDGVEPDGPSFPADILVVTEKQWRAAYYETQSAVAQDTLKKRYARAKKSLIDKGAVGSVGQWVWPIDENGTCPGTGTIQ